MPITVALTGCARGDHTHQLASYFLVRFSTDLVLLSIIGEHWVKLEDICMFAPSDPPQILTSILYTVYGTLYTVTQTLCLYTLHFILYTVTQTVCLYTLHFIHFTLYTVYCVL